MTTTVILPKQGQSVETCIITEWYKKKGDKVEKGDLLFAYETDKASFEEEASVEGTLLDIFYESGDEVPVLAEVAVIGEEGEEVTRPEGAEMQEAKDESVHAEQAELALTIDPGVQESSYPIPEGKVRISPRARRLAAEKGLEIEGISGSGPNGRIIVRDIEEAILTAPVAASATIETLTETAEPQVRETAVPPASKPETPPPVPSTSLAPPPVTASTAGDSEDRPISNMRKLISRAMHASLQNSAQLTHHLSADARSILSLRSKVKKMQAEGYPENITLNDIVCYAVIRALKSHPGANVHYLGDSIRYFRKVHLGIAVDTDRGLMVPVLRNADDLSLKGLSEQLGRLADACRTGKIDPDLLQPEAATFTVSNLGNYGVEMFTPVINLPQAGILGVNTILERPARMEDGTFGFVPYMGLSLTYDHRALDGGPATQFLAEIKKEIENFNHDLIKQ